MQKIRKGMFETNSSSAHSIIIKKESIRSTSIEKEIMANLVGKNNIHYLLANKPEDLLFDKNSVWCETIRDKIRYLCAVYEERAPYIILPIIQKYIPWRIVFEYPERDGKIYYGCTYEDDDEESLNEDLATLHISLEELITNPDYIIFSGDNNIERACEYREDLRNDCTEVRYGQNIWHINNKGRK